MCNINGFGSVTSAHLLSVKRQYQTPVYLYDESLIRQRCTALRAMPNAFGLTVRYAMKANSTKALLRIVQRLGLHFDASSLNEALRAKMAGIPPSDIMLTTQEVYGDQQRQVLELLLRQGMRYNVCSLRQLAGIADFAASAGIPLSIRIHPGVGSGESASRNTGDNYSCFGIHLSDLEQALQLAKQSGLTFRGVHTHIGSGGDPEIWRNNIDLELAVVERFFPDATTVSFGGGLREARMPGEAAADVTQLGAYAKQRMEEFFERTGRKLHMEVEPGTYVMANAGYVVTTVMDKKRTGQDGLNFVIVDGGMEVNARPALYGSRHPFAIISAAGELLSSDLLPETVQHTGYSAAVVGRCCESGDSQTLDAAGTVVARPMAEPEVGDLLVIGGCGAYCSAMAPFNYNSHAQIAEVLLTASEELQIIRKPQTLEQIVANEI